MQELNILVSTDHNYVLQLRAMLRSLFVNNQDCSITVYLLHSGLPKEDLDLLGETAARFNAGFSEYTVSRKQKELAATVVSRFPPETYFRLFLMDYLPETVDRVLYLDCDILINGSLAELYNMPMSIAGEDGQTRHYLFAAAPDILEFLPEGHRDYQEACRLREQLELSDDEKYINAGVLLINLKLFRSVMTADEMLEIIDTIHNSGINLRYNDQDLINLMFKKYICYFDHNRYNWNPLHFLGRKEVIFNDPAIFHFYSKQKPWHDDYPRHNNLFRQIKALYSIYYSDDF